MILFLDWFYVSFNNFHTSILGKILGSFKTLNFLRQKEEKVTNDENGNYDGKEFMNQIN